ncbi:hypothetical protein QJS10_CPB17g01606 [Acorus calamus]|uniref:Uncharacterized protein n=1 Tax=Acorus calamus TaxID=4465 RepID=A0AAV9CUI8_ACOCL|nr:hypothetical protein QJS10_CPB17g01606 [Acorus calamus]
MSRSTDWGRSSTRAHSSRRSSRRSGRGAEAGGGRAHMKGVTDVLPFMEVDAKKIVSRVIEWAKELCISKSVFLMTMQNAPPVLHINREKKFRKSFRAMISTCLVKNLQARPSAERLLRHSVFKKARSQDYIVRTILEGLSTLGDHLKELKLKEDDMIEQQKIPDGKKEEMSQVVPAWLGCFPIKGDLIEAKVVMTNSLQWSRGQQTERDNHPRSAASKDLRMRRSTLRECSILITKRTLNLPYICRAPPTHRGALFAADHARTAMSNGPIAARKRVVDPDFETPNEPPPPRTMTVLNALKSKLFNEIFGGSLSLKREGPPPRMMMVLNALTSKMIV